MLYVGITKLYLKEDEFWGLTPRKFYALLKCIHIDNNPEKIPKQEKLVPIDQVGYI